MKSIYDKSGVLLTVPKPTAQKYHGSASRSGDFESILLEDLDEKYCDSIVRSYRMLKGNCMHFRVFIDGTAIKPIDDILMMIKRKELFNLKIIRSGYEIFINNCRFIEIKNLIETSATEYISVEFEYDDSEYNNTLKPETEKRAEKMSLLKHKIQEKNDIQ